MQDQITQAQVFSRLKEQYGDRETVARNARYAIRSFVAWGLLEDSKVKGCYEQCKPMGISEPNLTILLYEAALYVDKEGKAATLYGVSSIPSAFLVDGAGKIVAQGNELRGINLHIAIDKLIKN